MKILKCPNCGEYTLSKECKDCNEKTINPQPPKFSPEDRMGKYRRTAKEKERKSKGLI